MAIVMTLAPLRTPFTFYFLHSEVGFKHKSKSVGCAKHWDRFYHRHHDKFFKDRHYIGKDWGHYFSDSSSTSQENQKKLQESSTSERNQKIVLEVGCGVGNTLFPILKTFPDVFIHACDFSPQAISLVQENEAFIPERVNAFVCDVTLGKLIDTISPSSVDVVTLIFMLSAVSPKKMHIILKNIRAVLKPNGCVLFRDYCVGDFSQEKFANKNQMISENFYVRGDGTYVFYFSKDSLSQLFEECGFHASELSVYTKLIENRSRKVSMGRYMVNYSQMGNHLLDFFYQKRINFEY